MANKKIKLPKAPGTDTRGNIAIPGGARILDLSDYDDLFGDSSKEQKKESAWSQFKGGFTDALSNRLNTKDVVRNFLRSASPDGISTLFGAYDELKSSAYSIKGSLEQTNASDLDYVARTAKNYLPQLKDYLPKEFYDNLDQGLENKIDDYKYTIQGQQNQTAIRALNKEANENNVIQEALDNIALVSKQNHNKSERADQYRDKQQRAERGVRDIVTTKRFDYMARSMGMAVDNLSGIKAYQEQFDAGVKRKGLELQFRTYMGIKDLVKLTETSLKLQMQAAEQLVRNTGTPDYQKGGNAGLRNFNSKGGAAGGLIKGLASNGRQSLQQYLGGFGGNVEDRVTKDLSGRLSSIVAAARMGENSPGLWDQRYSLAGSMAGEFGGSLIKDHLVPMLGRKARPIATKAMNRYAGGKHNQIGYFMDNVPAFAQEFVNNQQNQYGARGVLRDIIAPYIPQHSLNDRVNNGNYQTIDQQASFNQMTQRSIVEVIPGLLSRSLQELRMIRTGRDDVEREVFDITTGKFAVEKQANDNLQKRIVPESAIRSASATINDSLNQMDSEGKLSPAARKALAERMLRESSNNKRFDPEQYLKRSGYKDNVDVTTTDELSSFFREKFKFDTRGKMADTADNHQLRQDWSQAFLDIRSISRDPYKEIQRLIDTGKTDSLRMMGIITTEGNQDKINYDRIWEILRSGVSDTNPYAPGGPGSDPDRDDMSGTKGHKDFVGPAYKGELDRYARNGLRRGRDRFGPDAKKARDATAKRLRELRAKYGNNAAKIAELMARFKDGETDEGSSDLQDTRDAMAKRLRELRAKYGNNSAKIKEIMDKLKESGADTLSSGYGNLTDYGDKLMNGQFNPPGIKDKAKSAYDAAMGNLGSIKPSTFVPKGMDALTDLYSKFDPTNPIVSKADLIKGNLIDLNTRKVVNKLTDITGPLINDAGVVMVSARDLAAGLRNEHGDTVVSGVNEASKRVADAVGRVKGLISGPPDVAPALDASKEQDAPQDLTLDPGGDVVIKARGIKDGEYFNRTTGKPVTSMDDLNGDIVDKEGNVVVTAQEVKDGLYNAKTGKVWRLTKGAKFVKDLVGKAAKFSGMTATQLGFHAIKFMGKAALGTALKAFNFVIDNQNAYLPDSPDPVFTRRALKEGAYYDEKGKVIKSFTDVYSLIYGKDGEPVLPLDQYKNLMNYDGSKHALAKNRTLFGRTVKRGFRAIRNAYTAASIRYWKWLGRKTASVGGKVGRKLFGGASKLGGNLLGKIFEQGDPAQATNPTNIILARILEQLQANEPPPPEREGSWKDKAKKKAAGLGNKLQDVGKDKDGNRGLIGGLLAGLGKLMGGKDKKKSEDDDGFGLDDLPDLPGGRDGDRGPPRRGRLARFGNYLKNSKVGKLIAGAGTALMGTKFGGAIARGAMAVATPLIAGVTAVMSAPAWMLAAGAVVVGGAGYLGYRKYKTVGDFKELRMLQYGITATGQKMDVLKLEAVLEKYTDKSAEFPQMTVNAENAKASLSAMGIDIKDEARVMAFSRWMETRFKPVYLSYCKALGSIGMKNCKLDEIDDTVPEELKADLLKAVKFPYEGETPYQYTDNPFDEDTKLEDTVPAIKELFVKLEKKFGVAKAKSDQLKATAETKATEVDPKTGKVLAASGTAVIAGQTKAEAEGLKTDADKKRDAAKANSKVTSALTNVKNAIKVAALSGVVSTVPIQKVGRELTALQSIRMRAYGMQTLSIAEVEAMLTLEYVYAQNLSVSNGNVDFQGDFTVFLREAGTYLGISTAAGTDSRNKLAVWLTARFAPVFRAYWGAVKRVAPSVQVQGVEGQLKTVEKITVANAVMGATNPDGDSVWEVPTIFEVTGNLIELKTLAEADLKHLKDVGDKEIAGTPTQKSSEQVAGKVSASTGGSFFESVKETAKSSWDATKSAATSAWDKTKEFFGGEPSSKSTTGLSFPEGGYKNTTGKTVAREGTTYGAMASGNGGKWEEIPYPSTNGSLGGAKATFKAAAALVGVPAELLFIIAGIESTYRYDIKASTSSAYGYFQFINDTWDYMYAKCQSKYGLPNDDAIRSMRKDPRIQSLLGGEFIKGNYERLQKALSREISDTDIYIAHFLGAAGAVKFLKADPDALGYQVFQKEYSSNMTIFFVGGKRTNPRTIAQIYKLFDDKIAKFRTGEGKSTTGPETPGNQSTLADVEAKQIEATQSKDDASLLDGNVAANDDVKDPNGTAPVSPGATIAGTAPGAPGMSPASTNGQPSSGAPSSSPSQDSGGSSVDAQRQSNEEAVLNAQQRRELELRKSNQTDQAVDKIQSKQLDTLYEIRDYLKTIAMAAGNNVAANAPDGGQNTAVGSGTNNSMNSPIQNRTAQQRPSPMTLR